MNKPRGPHVLLEMYEALRAEYGPQHWWPADSPTEVIIGAILTQNTAWRNVEKAIASMKRARCLDFHHIHHMEVDALASIIRSCGTYRSKALRLKAFADWLITTHDGDLAGALSARINRVREALLAIRGIGPETADAILLYAAGRATFVVDAYTRRVLRRHHLLKQRASYAEAQTIFARALPRDARLYNEYHALLVEVGKRHCKTRAVCAGCPLRRWPHDELV